MATQSDQRNFETGQAGLAGGCSAPLAWQDQRAFENGGAFISPCGAGNSAISGCMDPAAENYNPAATQDDGSCVYPAICSLNLANTGGDSGYTQTFPLASTGYIVYLGFDAKMIPDRLVVTSNLGALWDTGCIGTALGGTGRAYQAIPIAAGMTQLTLQVLPNCSGPTTGTVWDLKARCEPFLPTAEPLDAFYFFPNTTATAQIPLISTFTESISATGLPSGWSVSASNLSEFPVLNYTTAGMASGASGSFNLVLTNPFGSLVKPVEYHIY